MAKKRMFNKIIVAHDEFLDMPLSTQALYFHLCMNADDYGFVSPKGVMRMVGANADDLKVLSAKRYVLPFDSGVVVIKHWLINNTVRKDRSTQTTYTEEYESLAINSFGAYTEKSKIAHDVEEIASVVTKLEAPVEKLATPNRYQNEVSEKWQPNGNQMATQIRLDKIRLDKKVSKDTYVDPFKIKNVFEYYLQCFGANPNLIKLSDSRKTKLRLRLEDAGEENLKKAILNTSRSAFHRGDNDRNWKANLDWIIKSYEQVERLAEMETLVHEKATNGKVKAPSLEEVRKNFERL